MRKLIGLTIVAGGVALAVVIGQRMSTDAMAVVIGVAVGVMASIPTSLLVMAAMRRGQAGYEPRPEREREYRGGHYPQPAQPQIYIVSPGGQSQQAAPWLQNGMQQLPPPAGYYQPESTRRYKVVGQDEYYLDDATWE